MKPFFLFQRPHPSSSRVKNLTYCLIGYPHIGTRIRGSAVFSLFNLPRSAQILDIGCGSGYFSYELAKRGYSVISMDSFTGITPKDITILHTIFRKGKRPLHFVNGTGTSLPFPDATFDCVFIIDVIEHIPDDHAVMREISRVLKKGGTLIASTPSTNFHNGKFKPFFRWFHQHTLLRKLPIWNETELYEQSMMRAKGHLREYSLDQWKKLLTTYNFTLEAWQPEYKFFGAFFVELYHSFKLFRTYTGPTFLFYPLTKLDHFIPARGTGIAIRGRKHA